MGFLKKLTGRPSDLLEEKYAYVYKSPFDSEFEYNIRERGSEYYSNNKLENVVLKGDSITASVIGSEVYSVSVNFIGDSKMSSTSCTCKYYGESKRLCKHIYAAVLYYAKSKNIKGFTEERINCTYHEPMGTISKSYNEYIRLYEIYKKQAQEYDYGILEDYEDRIAELIEKARKYKTTILKNITAEMYDDAYYVNENLKENVKAYVELVKNTEKEELETQETDYEELVEKYKVERQNETTHERTSLLDIARGVLDFVDSISGSSDESSKEDELRKIERDYGLSREEAKLVQNGKYEPWQFEEEDLEEDDYYYDDPF